MQTASASVSIDVGGMPGVGLLNGLVWHDADFDDVPTTNERKLAGWIVELYRNDTLAHVATTSADGVYRMSGIVPNYATTDTYELRFRRPGATASTALLGRAHSEFTNELQRITEIVVLSGSNLQNLNLPIDPNGIVYDSLSRAPIAGARSDAPRCGLGRRRPRELLLRFRAARSGHARRRLLQVRPQFLRCRVPERRRLLIRVTPPSAAYIAGVSDIIPPPANDATAPFSVPACPRRSTTPCPRRRSYCEVRSRRSSRRRLRSARARRHELSPARAARRQLRAGHEPDLQQPHSARPRPRRVGDDHEDDAARERVARSARAVRDHRRRTGSA